MYFCVPLCNPVDLCVARGLRLMYAYISLNLYQQKQISWFVEPPYSELLQKLSGGIRGSPLSASFIHGIYYVYTSLSCLYFRNSLRGRHTK